MSKDDYKTMLDQRSTACKPNEPIPFTIQEYYSQVTTTEAGGGWRAKDRMVGSFSKPVPKDYAWLAISNQYMMLSRYDAVFKSGRGWKDLMPFFGDEFSTGSWGDTTYMVIGPRFWVSKQVTGSVEADADDDAFVYINGVLIGKSNNQGFGLNTSYTFQPRKGYRIVVVHFNGGGTGRLESRRGFSEVIPFMIKQPQELQK
jgi:hypothetical protein